MDNKKQVYNSNKKRKKNKIKGVLLFFLGGIVGFVNGFFGGGGGVVGVPIIEKFLTNDNKKAHATCLALILPLSIISSAVYIFYGQIESLLFLNVTLGVIIGGIVGALLLKVLPEKVVRAIFVAILLYGGIRLICSF